MSAQTHFDVIISGGGAVGCSLIVGLQKLCYQQPLKIAIIEAHDNTQTITTPSFDARVIALSANSIDFYRRLNLESKLASISTPIKNIHVSDQGNIGQCVLKHQDYQVPELGRVIELNALGDLLQSEIDSASVTRFQPESITEIAPSSQQLALTLSSGTRITGKLLVVAEGALSATRKLLKVSHSTKSYQQAAIIANLKCDRPHENWAYERFTPFGPLAMLPMNSNWCSMVWSVSPEEVDNILALSEPDILEKIQSEFGLRMGRFEAISKRFAYPLNLVTSDEVVGHRVAVVGNAAQTLHPIAGQGLNLGLRDIAALCRCIASNISDLGGFATLKNYKDSRLLDRDNTIRFTDGLVELFSKDDPLVGAVRNLGLLGLHFNRQLKRQFAYNAMGQK